MKRILFSVIVLVLTIAAAGQTLKVTTSSGTKEYQASLVMLSMPVVDSSVFEKYIFERFERTKVCEPAVRVLPLMVSDSDDTGTEAFSPSVVSKVR